MNWGYKIIGFYAIFVAGIVFLVIKSSMQNNDLVTTNYYEKELNYQQTIDQTSRTGKLSEKVQYQQQANGILITLPKEMATTTVKANVTLYCAADQRKDQSVNLTTTTGQFLLPLKAQTTGNFEVKLNWMADGESYYDETKIFLQ